MFTLVSLRLLGLTRTINEELVDAYPEAMVGTRRLFSRGRPVSISLRRTTSR